MTATPSLTAPTIQARPELLSAQLKRKNNNKTYLYPPTESCPALAERRWLQKASYGGATAIAPATFGLPLNIRARPLIGPCITVGRSLFLTLAERLPKDRPHPGARKRGKMCHGAIYQGNTFLPNHRVAVP